jgi:hypothetical protein
VRILKQIALSRGERDGKQRSSEQGSKPRSGSELLVLLCVRRLETVEKMGRVRVDEEAASGVVGDENTGNGSTGWREGKIFDREWSNFGVEWRFSGGERRAAEG